MLSSETPLRERLMYKRSPARVKTLDVLARSTAFPQQPAAHLVRFCSLAREEGGAASAEQAGEFLQQRYDWEVSSRAEELAQAWSESQPSQGSSGQGSSGAAEEKKQVVEENQTAVSTEAAVVYPDRVYLSVKKDAFTKPTLLCQIQDHEKVKFTGDAGAIGRLTVKEDSDLITIDLKGQQYEGGIQPGPTVLVVNTSHNPFATKSTSAAPVQERLKIESITNEFVDFKFKKDLMSDLIGSYTGDINSMKPERKLSSTSGKAKKRKKHDDDDEDSEDGYDEAVTTARSNPKITTINRKQGKKSTKKKKTASKKVVDSEGTMVTLGWVGFN